ncbi:jg23412, partial [Pararge aegeria aegeria]
KYFLIEKSTVCSKGKDIRGDRLARNAVRHTSKRLFLSLHVCSSRVAPKGFLYPARDKETLTSETTTIQNTQQVEDLERRADALEEQLARELDNGRHLRTLVKLGSVNERPE